MLRTVKDLQNYAIGATDGTIGKVKDFYFDDEAWVIRYLVVDTGTWLSSRKVLISPYSIGEPDWVGQILPVSITKKQVMDGPNIDTDKPVSRQHEIRYLGYYGYPYYWGGAGLWGQGAYPGEMLAGSGYAGTDAEYRRAQAANARIAADADAERQQDEDPHLRSCGEVIQYQIHASDGDIGHVQGMLVDDRTWAIRYIMVNTSNWWLGHQVLISPEWIEDVSWSEAKVAINLTRQAVKAAPTYDAGKTLERNQEVSIYKHYGRAGYWTIDDDRESERSSW